MVVLAEILREFSEENYAKLPNSFRLRSEAVFSVVS
jgi:hypothetical protein